MKAALLTAPYSMIITESPDLKPATGQDAVLRVSAAGICGSDIHAYRGEHSKRKPPVILGHELAGEVVSVGADVKDLKMGDRVTVEPQESCGVCPECTKGNYNLCGSKRLLGATDWPGGFGEYVRVPSGICYRLGEKVPMHHAALAEPLAVGAHAIRCLADSNTRSRLLVVGAGPIGLLVALAARSAGFENLAVADTKRFNVDAGLRMGVAYGIHVTGTPLKQAVQQATGWDAADAVFVAAGGPAGIGGALSVVRPRGQVIVLAHYGEPTPTDLMDIQARELNVLGSKMYTTVDFQQAVDMLNTAQLPCDSVITHRIGLDELPPMMERLNGNPEGVIKVVVEFDDSSAA